MDSLFGDWPEVCGRPGRCRGDPERRQPTSDEMPVIADDVERLVPPFLERRVRQFGISRGGGVQATGEILTPIAKAGHHGETAWRRGNGEDLEVRPEVFETDHELPDVARVEGPRV